ncbi:MAG: TPP-dependent pyruvate/acetoin dehydrogenase alpha subunit [Halocynthiibacter sp.]|jgi:TPP-dependent pyruvate/acetoin dehydrogenase alpha subunit
MTYVQELPSRSKSGSSSGNAGAPKAPRKRARIPFMTLLVGGVTALSIGLGVMNTYLEDWAVAYVDFGALSSVEFISADIEKD